MQFVKTLNIGCEDDGLPVDPHKSYVIRFCDHTGHALCPVVTHLSKAFLCADLYQQEGAINKPYEVSIIFGDDRKRKSSDPESGLDRVLWMIDKMKAPRGGIKISVYINENMNRVLDSTWQTHHMWRTEDVWDKSKTGNYVTIQRVEKESKADWHKENVDECFDLIYELCETYDVEVIELDYETPYEEMYQALLHSKMHFSYVGASYFMAALTQTPTLGIGLAEDRKMTIYTPVAAAVEKESAIFKNVFCFTAGNPGHFLKYEDGQVVNGVNTTCRDTSSPYTVKTELQKVLKELWK